MVSKLYNANRVIKPLYIAFTICCSVALLFGCASDKESADANTNNQIADIAIEPKTTQVDHDMIAYYDPSHEYIANPNYKVFSIAVGPMALYSSNPDIKENHGHYAHWAEKMNVNYSWDLPGYTDIDDFRQTLLNLAEEGVDGLLIEYYSNTESDNEYLENVEIALRDSGLPWMYGMMTPSPSHSYPGLAYPRIEVSDYTRGAVIAEKLLELKEELFPDIPYEKTGFMTLGDRRVQGLIERVKGAEDIWLARTGLSNSIIRLDDSLLWHDSEYPPIEQALIGHPQYECILFGTMIADSGALSTLNYFDSSLYQGQPVSLIIVTSELTFSDGMRGFEDRFIGDRWVAGYDDAVKAAVIYPRILHAEVIMGALYSFMSGMSTPDTIWPSWKNSESDSPVFTPPFHIITPSNFLRFYKWIDDYTGSEPRSFAFE